MAEIQATVFCDFDGTITTEDTFDLVAGAVVPEVWWPLKRRMFNFEINLREGMAALAAALSPTHLEEMRQQLADVPLRPGFLPFLDSLEAAGVPFVLVSGGLLPLVEQLLGSHRHRFEQLVAAEVRSHAPGGVQFHSPFASADELVAKAQVLERFGRGKRIVIGDSITDLRMAEVADLVFAREPLSGWLQQRSIAHHRWRDFDDVAAELRRQGLLPASPA